MSFQEPQQDLDEHFSVLSYFSTQHFLRVSSHLEIEVGSSVERLGPDVTEAPILTFKKKIC